MATWKQPDGLHETVPANVIEDEVTEEPKVPEKNRKPSAKEKHKASLQRIMRFSQYMRQENEEDIDLITRVHEQIKSPQGWEEEDHREDFRPSYWFKKDNFVIELYATMGAVAILFGELRKGVEPRPGSTQDFTMINPTFPPIELPIWDDEEDEENLESTAEKFSWYVEQIEDYIKELEKERKSQANISNGESEFQLISKRPVANLFDPLEKILATGRATKTQDTDSNIVKTEKDKPDRHSEIIKRYGKAFFKRTGE